ncbi:MAG: aspartate kinase [Flavobacteriales bacterium]|nr:aspartate kinase [Flavobacteriales bacterium]
MRREVHKFGGASVRDAEAVRNVGRIVLGLCSAGIQPVVVVSAMAKTTNALEKIWTGLPEGGPAEDRCTEVLDFHAGVAQDLALPSDLLQEDVAKFLSAAQALNGKPQSAEGYDALVGFGERMSTRIVQAHLVQLGLPAHWLSAWKLIQTDTSHRAAQVELVATGVAVRTALSAIGGGLAVTQGFVGGAASGAPTTLGREGSDFSGALLAEAGAAERLVVWKDVEGVMTGDPRRWPFAQKIERLDHGTAERMSLAGAGVLHPATMAPLRRTGIPLEVRSFQQPDGRGTVIDESPIADGLPVLWAFGSGASGSEEVRCITDNTAQAIAEWNAAFPDRLASSAVADPDIEGCSRLVF